MTLSGAHKAAIWILSAEEDFAIETMSYLEEAEVRALAELARKMEPPSLPDLKKVQAEFAEKLKDESLVLNLRRGSDYVRHLTARAFGDDRADLIIDGAPPPPPSERPDLSTAEASALTPLLEKEHPQVVAAVLSSLDDTVASAVLANMSEELRVDVLARIAHLKRIPAGPLAQAQRLLANGLPMRRPDDDDVDGVRVAASFLNKLDSDEAEAILDMLGEDSRDLAQEVRQAMFTFEDLASLDRKGFQALLKEVPSEQLMLALKTASDSLQEAIFGSLSRRAAEMLKEDLQVLGPVRLADVEQAQQAIVGIALQLRADGRINIAGSGEDFV